MRRSLACLGLVLLGCSAEALDAPAGDAWVELDQAARDAGWTLRVGGFCFVLDGSSPVDVPIQEWALVERVKDDELEHRWLPLEPDTLLRVTGEGGELELWTGPPSETPEAEEEDALGSEP